MTTPPMTPSRPIVRRTNETRPRMKVMLQAGLRGCGRTDLNRLAGCRGRSVPVRRSRAIQCRAGPMKALLVLCFTAQAACALTPHAEPVSRQSNGAAVLLDLTPANRPALVGALDFDLLAAGTGAACADRGSAKTYWVSIAELATVSSDSLTRQAIAAAVTDAVSRLDDIDGILLTRVVTESRGPDRV